MKSIRCLATLGLLSVFVQSGCNAAADRPAATAKKQGTDRTPGDTLVLQTDRVSKFPFSVGTSALAQPDGKILIASAVHANPRDVHGWDAILGNYGMHVAFSLIRLNPNNSLDTTFGDNGVAFLEFGKQAGVPKKILIQPDGKILVVGYLWAAWHSDPTFTSFSNVVVRFGADGRLDTTYGHGGIAALVFPGFVAAAAVQPDGKLLIGGGSGKSGEEAFKIMRLDENGAPDRSFNDRGLPADFSSRQIVGFAVARDGAIWVVGQNGPRTVYAKSTVAKLRPDGTPDPSFGYHGYTLLKDAVAGEFADGFLMPDGKFVIVGTGLGTLQVAKIGADGLLDKTYGKAGIGSIRVPKNAVPVACVASPKGDIYVGAAFGDLFQIDLKIAHFKPDGSSDTSFGQNGLTSSAVVLEDVTQRAVSFSPLNNNGWMALSPDGRLFLTGFQKIKVEEGNSSHSEVKTQVTILRR